MVVVPQLGGHKQLLTAYGPGREQVFERRADLRFVAVPLGGVEVAETDLDRGLHGIGGLCPIGQRSAEPERRNLTTAVVQGESVLTQIFISHGRQAPIPLFGKAFRGSDLFEDDESRGPAG